MPKHKRKRAALFEVFQNESPASGGGNGSRWNLRPPAWFSRGKSADVRRLLEPVTEDLSRVRRRRVKTP